MATEHVKYFWEASNQTNLVDTKWLKHIYMPPNIHAGEKKTIHGYKADARAGDTNYIPYNVGMPREFDSAVDIRGNDSRALHQFIKDRSIPPPSRPAARGRPRKTEELLTNLLESYATHTPPFPLSHMQAAPRATALSHLAGDQRWPLVQTPPFPTFYEVDEDAEQRAVYAKLAAAEQERIDAIAKSLQAAVVPDEWDS